MQNQAAPLATRPERRLSYDRVQRRSAPYLFVSPFFILYLVFGLFPTLFSLYLAFHLWNPADGWGAWKFVGWENFGLTLTDPLFWKSLGNTVSIALLSGIPQHLIAIPLAFVIHTGLKKLQSPITTVYFMPYITSSVAIAIVFGVFFSEHYGLLNYVLGGLNRVPLLGLLIPEEPINWLGRTGTIQPAIALVVFWRYVGWNTVLYLSGLQAIPGDLYEAATVDGASRAQQFRFITLPLLRPMMFYAVTLTIIGNMQLFDEAYMLVSQDGGVGNAGLTTAMYMYNTAFRDLDMGLASSISWLLFLAIFLFSLLNNFVFSRGGRED